MPLTAGLRPRRGHSSELNLRRHSSVMPDDEERPVSPPVQEENAKHRRFSMLKFRHASDSQLSTRARLQAQEDIPPIPSASVTPQIIKTAPTMEIPPRDKRKTRLLIRPRASMDEPRLSESSLDNFFRLPRRRKQGHLFPLPDRTTPPRPSTSSRRPSTSSPRSSITQRERSNTLNSLKMTASQDPLPTPPLRTSTSTGRRSFGDLLGLSHRLRQNSEPRTAPATPGSTASNSLQLSRDKEIVLPERFEDESPANYLVRLEEALNRGVVASVLAKATDPFTQAVLRSYMRGFSFFGDPIDMSIRKLLMEAELPKETQQIDRFLQSFANRYHECNPGIYESPDQAYYIAFSLLILHTDVFNKNNKNKMQKSDYVRNTRNEEIFDDILECFYDNISYTPFIHVEDDLDINGERIIPGRKRTIFSQSKPSGPIDPYTLIIDGKLDSLRPSLKDVMYLEEHYNYLGTAKSLNLQELQNTFFKTGVLQIVSARSRPDAFMSEKTVTNPEEAHPGIVDIKVTKVGLLWRKDAKKKKTRSPWQEWGAILTGAQLYFFRNTNWVKGLMHQLETQSHDGTPVTFRPPLEQFKPDALMSTDNAVALLDSTYKKHKNAFVFVRHGGFEEILLADNEDEMNDWLAKLNYAAAFKTAGVRMRGVVGGHYDGQRSRGIRRLGSSSGNAQSISTPTGEVTIVSGKIDVQMAQDILAARRDVMQQQIEQMEEKLTAAQRVLEINLRNARHLQILAPIQPRTREQVLSSAAKMAAKLKWMRVEIWRLRCHRDILALDLEEEKREAPSKEQPVLHTLPPLEIPRTRRESTPSLAQASSRTSIPHSAEQAVLEEAGVDLASPEESQDVFDEKEKLHRDRSKIRRSLQRTLRDAHPPSHHRSRKGKDSSSSAAVSDDTSIKDGVLNRGTGSFVVHGKKASVITFGSELQNLSQRKPSATSTSTTKSFREAFSRLGTAPLDGSAVSDGESETFSIVEQQIPVPTVDDAAEDSPVGQNAFYTPESSSPVSLGHT